MLQKGSTMKDKSPSRTLRGTLLAAGAAASAVLYAQAMSLRPGNYEFVFTSQVALPPELAAKLPPGYADKLSQQPRTEQKCITASDLDKVRRQLHSSQEEDEGNCTMSDQSIVGTHVKFTEHCPHGTGVFDGTVTSDSIDGTVLTNTDEGAKMTVKIKAHRLGDCAK
jgi:Protein of unknown function (DUF3617)